MLKEHLVIGTHPGQLGKNTYDEFANTLTDISASTEKTQATLDAINVAIQKVKTEVIMPQTGESYYIKSASSPYDNRGHFLFVDHLGNPASSLQNQINGNLYIWDVKEGATALILVNKGVNKQIQPNSMANTAFAMGMNNVPVSFTYLGQGQFNILSGNMVYHRSASALNSVVNYQGGLNSASAWYIYKADDTYYKEGLKTLILDADELIKNTALGQNPGQVSSEIKDKLNQAISKAQNATVEYKTVYDELQEAIQNFKAAKVQIIFSTAEKEQLYYIVSGSSQAYCKGMVMKGNEKGAQMNFVTKQLDPTMVWKFIDRGNGKVAIQNKASGLYIASSATSGCTDTPADYSLVDLDYQGQYNIKYDNASPLHCQDNGKLIVNWAGGVNTASAWCFEALTEEEMNRKVSIYDIVAKQGRTSTGIGNKDATLLSLEVLVQGLVGETKLSSLTFNLDGTTRLADIQKIHLYKTSTNYRFRKSDALLLASVDPTNGDITVDFDTPLELNSGSNFLWITCDVSDEATEGNKIDAQVISCVNTEGETILSGYGNPAYAATIFTTQATVLMCGDWNSKYYRIPAIATADNGTLVAVADKRIHSNVDLPAHVDVYVNLSIDNGKTWSDPICIAGDEPGNIGYGDAAIVKNKNGRLIVLYNGGPNGLFNSSVAAPFRKYKVHSDDNGLTWSKPVDITKQLYATGCTDPVAAQWTSMLLTSGAGICTRDGVLMLAVAAAVPGRTGFSDYAAVSYDDGDTWYVESAQTAWSAGDEAKLVELNNGDIMISMRRGVSRQINTSPDKGKTWRTPYPNTQLISPACNGEILRYTSQLDGYDKNRILHSLPYASGRENVSVMLSYDEGVNYPVRKTICPGASAYSALTILQNGNIGCYFEDGGENMDMVFVSFTLDWLTNGNDFYTKPVDGIKTKPVTLFKAWVEDGYIKTNALGKATEVYHTTGVKQDPKKKVSAGIYLVKSGNEVCSIVVK